MRLCCLFLKCMIWMSCMNGKKVVCLKALDFRGAEWPSVSSSFTVSSVRFAKSLGSLWDVCHSIVQDQETH